MNDRLEHELSQLLDGRLPSGRREQLLDHLADDDESTRILDEMEQAQELARSLPTFEVGRGFSETLWQRIRSGEGTPDAVFREPLPLWTKVRYLTTGALTAAAVLVAAHLLTRTAPDAARTAPNPNTEVADSTGGLRPRQPDPYLSAYQIIPESVARAGQIECVEAVSTLQHRAPDVERRLEHSDPREIVVALEPEVGRARGATSMMRWMQRQQMIDLPGEFDAALSLTEKVLQRLDRASTDSDRGLLRVAVQDLKDLEVDGLRQRFAVLCCSSTSDFMSQLRDQLVRNPDVGRALRITFTDDGASGSILRLHRIEPFGADPMGNGVIIFQRNDISPPSVRVPGGGTQSIGVDVQMTITPQPHGLRPKR